MGRREAGDSQVMGDPWGRGVPQGQPRGLGGGQEDNRSVRKVGGARREGRGTPKGVGPGEGGSPRDPRAAPSVGMLRMWESGHVGVGGHVRPEGVGVT